MSRCTKVETPTAIVLLGATGDLARKKLLSALMDLYAKGVLPDRFHIIAFSKDTLSNEEYRSFVRGCIVAQKTYNDEDITRFLSAIEYVQGLFDDRGAFAHIRKRLETYDESIGMCTSKLFYLAVPPVFYETIFEQIAAVKLETPCLMGDGWTRILVEKPFGNDLTHARYLEKKLSELFREEQIYRIDHYLAKDSLQNILAFRFSNTLFAHAWSREYIDLVYIRVSEKIDVGTRGAFFDGVGALRDVGQNHMLQMLALIAMEYPPTLEPDALRNARAEVLRHLCAPNGRDLVKGQYEGYTATDAVRSDSDTETYFALKTYVDTKRWEGVPFYLEHGKALADHRVEISVRFRSSEQCFCGTHTPHDHHNTVRFSIAPEQKITVRFQVRTPGLKYALEPNDLVFDRAAEVHKAGILIADAYEEVLFDAICGDQTLFVSSKEQEAAWHYITSVLTLWKDTKPLPYAKGSNGPSAALTKELHNSIHLFR